MSTQVQVFFVNFNFQAVILTSTIETFLIGLRIVQHDMTVNMYNNCNKSHSIMKHLSAILLLTQRNYMHHKIACNNC